MTPVLLAFPDDRPLAASVARQLGAHLGRCDWRHFPDGESLVAIDDQLSGADVVLFASLDDPDRKAIPLRFAARTAREFGARRIGLVAPYLAYMRQDARFHPGEAISAQAFAQFLDETVDWLVTVDPHLHRIADPRQVFHMPVDCIAAAPLLAEWIRREVARPMLIGPDSESAQWVSTVASAAHAPYEVLHKVRHGDRDVEIGVPRVERLHGYTPVLLDDIASTGQTLVAAIQRLRGSHLPPPVCVVIHPIFAGDAWERLRMAGAGRIVSTDSIVHPTNAISLADPIAAAIARRLGDGGQARSHG